ncbi:hypothetical protein QM012_002599 [Aureobasidium pullulans]|uniref:Uncharacterized protein n=1 Tax=Aureobasidium pullulans TaxID=5580 RepID=A0ABR0TA21_AURPU
MAPWCQPLKSPLFLSGVIINAILAFFLLWAVRNRGPRIWLFMIIAMIGVGTFQAAFVLVSLCLEKPPAPLIIDIPLGEFEPAGNSSSNEDSDNEQ